ncbi:MAG: hypothetical protein BWY17_02182 [Deltaproteobacteria bacterium ADurb.Bin207]|nr:MAG: hypothetical protein BWY17_02182 [Deltaproteobacteria bacterium ADurb.Bin207]
MRTPIHIALMLAVVSGSLLNACGARSPMQEQWADAGVEPDATLDAPSDVVYDHVNDINGCNPSTCSGCCDLQGNCRTGTQPSACGQGGYECVDCSSLGQTCITSTRTCGAVQPCNPSTCPQGCCHNGLCVEGASHEACGSHGMDCVNCASLGQTCNPYSLTCEQSSMCDPTNCAGCCDAWNQCNWGGDPWACGFGGGGCEDCASQGLTCDPFWGGCVTVEPCGPWNCLGCCDMVGNCQWGADDWACGGNGELCQDCSAFNSSCDSQTHTCTGTQLCGPENCKGCCDPYSGQCRMGWDPWACGSAGQICQDCTGSNMICGDSPFGGGQCLSISQTCGPNCKGCCACNTTGCQCLGGTDIKACGHDGQICQDCTIGQGQCIHEPMGNTCISTPPPPTCGPWNCPGCCVDGTPPTCVEGLDAWQCGWGGQFCSVCYPGEACVWQPWGGGQCMAMTDWGPPDGGPADAGMADGFAGCNASNCAGCCGANGQCRAGKSVHQCGRNGELCENCAVKNQVCSDGDCKNP